MFKGILILSMSISASNHIPNYPSLTFDLNLVSGEFKNGDRLICRFVNCFQFFLGGVGVVIETILVFYFHLIPSFSGSYV